MKELIGKTITAMYVNQDESMLKFSIQGGEDIVYITNGDCCSETWFADIIFNRYNDKFPMAVNTVVELQIPAFVSKMADYDGRGRQEYDQVYGYGIAGGVKNIEIIYRNSSNGYYGGSCEVADMDSSYDKKRVDAATWTSITDDWSAVGNG